MSIMTGFNRLCVASMLLLSCCADPLSADRVGLMERNARQAQGGSDRCTQTSASLPLLGMPGDSPILPVQLRGHKAAMFFSPGFVPLLFRNNDAVSFPRLQDLDLRLQDGEVISVSASVARGLSFGDLGSADRTGYLLSEPDNRTTDGRPIVGMLGRDILPEGAVVDLDIPGRRLAISIVQPACPNVSHTPPPRLLDMQRDILTVPVRINGQPVQAVLEPDLPVSIFPGKLASKIGIVNADLANDPTIITKFGKRVLGRRHHVMTLDVGDTRLRHFAFDVEDDVQYVMLGLNFFETGQATFDFANWTFSFRQTTDIVPSPTGMHFDQTKVAHVNVDQ